MTAGRYGKRRVSFVRKHQTAFQGAGTVLVREGGPAAPHPNQRFVLSVSWILDILSVVQERTYFILTCIFLGYHLTSPLAAPPGPRAGDAPGVM